MAWVIIEFDLPTPETTYHTPTVTFCKLANIRLRHFSKNSQLHRLRHQVLWLDRQHLCDLHGESWQMLVHSDDFLTSRRGPVVVTVFLAGRRGGRFGFRFKTRPSARCALRLGEGPRALGFSISEEKLNHESEIASRLCCTTGAVTLIG